MIRPSMARWNRVFVPYCSGDMFEGQMAEAGNPFDPADTSWKGYFSGHRIVAEVFAALKTGHGASASAAT